MDLEITLVPLDDSPVLRNLMQLYLYDFTEYTGEDVNQHGLYANEYLDLYWLEPTRRPYLFRLAGRLAGFALVRGVMLHEGHPAGSPPAGPSGPLPGERVHYMAEFFVMRKYRRQGIGAAAACRLFDLLPGWWRVEQEQANLPAQVFWRRVIGGYTRGRFTEISDPGWHGPAQQFHSPPADPLD